jgi:hypothetical protein
MPFDLGERVFYGQGQERSFPESPCRGVAGFESGRPLGEKCWSRGLSPVNMHLIVLGFSADLGGRQSKLMTGVDNAPYWVFCSHCSGDRCAMLMDKLRRLFWIGLERDGSLEQ